MSQSDEELRRFRNNLYAAFVSITLLWYDYGLTLPAEVSRFWPGPLNCASFFFYLNRYSSLFIHIPMLVNYLTQGQLTHDMCRHLQLYHQYISVISQVIVGVMLVIRTYALYERDKKVLLLIVAVVVIALVVGLWAFLSTKSLSRQSTLCFPPLTKEEGTRFGAAWSGMLVVDTVIFVLTFRKAVSLGNRRNVKLLKLLIRDGSIYFIIMIAANLFNVLTFLLGGCETRGIGTTFTNAISSIMMSRLALNLRDPSLVQEIISPYHPSVSSVHISHWSDAFLYSSHYFDTNKHASDIQVELVEITPR